MTTSRISALLSSLCRRSGMASGCEANGSGPSRAAFQAGPAALAGPGGRPRGPPAPSAACRTAPPGPSVPAQGCQPLGPGAEAPRPSPRNAAAASPLELAPSPVAVAFGARWPAPSSASYLPGPPAGTGRGPSLGPKGARALTTAPSAASAPRLLRIWLALCSAMRPMARISVMTALPWSSLPSSELLTTSAPAPLGGPSCPRGPLLSQGIVLQLAQLGSGAGPPAASQAALRAASSRPTSSAAGLGGLPPPAWASPPAGSPVPPGVA